MEGIVDVFAIQIFRLTIAADRSDIFLDSPA
jgi:hypothetical protein